MEYIMFNKNMNINIFIKSGISDVDLKGGN